MPLFTSDDEKAEYVAHVKEAQAIAAEFGRDAPEVLKLLASPAHYWQERRGSVAPDPATDAQLWKVHDLGGDKLAARVMGKRLTSSYIDRLKADLEGDAPPAPPRPVATPPVAMVAAPPVDEDSLDRAAADDGPFKPSRPLVPDEAAPATHIPPPQPAEPARTTTPPPAPAPATPSAGGRAATAEAKRIFAEKRGSTTEAPRRAVTPPPPSAAASKSAPTSTEGPCEKCGTKDLNDGKWNTDPRKDPHRIAEFSRQNFNGNVYCLGCQKTLRKAKKVA